MLRARFILAFGLVFVLAGGYFYQAYSAVCAWPLQYRVGELDPRFNLDVVMAESALAEAVTAWEEGIGEDLFVQHDEADFTINFVFDERQALTSAEARERQRLEAVEAQSADVQAAYEAQVQLLNEREKQYEERSTQYERDLARYNQTVASYNDEGGAPPEVFAELEAERERLAEVQAALSTEVVALNDLVAQINELGAEGNVLIDRLNDRVDDFNETFADGREFTQGDYQGDRINIYSFADEIELYTVLVHELGHALGIDHVKEETAFMHFLLSEQDASAPLTMADIDAYTATCDPTARLAVVPEPFRTLFAWLGL